MVATGLFRRPAAVLAAAAMAVVLSAAFTRAADPPPAPRGFDPAALDRTASPCDDFYQFACGGWLSRNPVPPDASVYSRHDELEARNALLLRDLLDRAARAEAGRDAIDQKIGDDYASCMDTAAIEKHGTAALAPHLEEITGIRTRAELASGLARLHTQGVRVLFWFGSRTYLTGRRRYVGFLEPDGMTLGPPDDYRLVDARRASARTRYRAHVQKMLELLGEPPARAARQARTVLEIETALARVMPRNIWGSAWGSTDLLLREDRPRFAPGFDWDAYFKGTTESWTALGVTWPAFFEALGRQVAARPLADWRAYLRWRVVESAAPLLPSAFVGEEFAFHGREREGLRTPPPRWKQCLRSVEGDLGWALGQRYLEAAYPTARRDQAARLVSALERALDRDIQQLPWLSDPTRQRALAIRAAILAKVGGPEGSPDYSGVLIKRGDPLGNAWRAAAAGKAAEWASIERESDPRQWSRLPTTVNAFYDREGVTITVPAAILQSPFLDLDMDDAATFGSAGSLIGHELMHAFDASGQEHGERGRPEDWTGPDAAEFDKRAACFAAQYSELTTAGGARVDGGRTLDETLADAGGVRIAYMALQDTIAMRSASESRSAALGASRPSGASPPEPQAPAVPPDLREGFTADQRFFLGYGQSFCSSETPSYVEYLSDSGWHAPAQHRVNGIVSNMPEFQKAFQCPAGSKMVRPFACRVW